MQYITTCLDEDCGYKYRDPTESSALDRLNEHIEETGHEVALQGEYDTPIHAGVHTEGYHRPLRPDELPP